MTHTGGPNRSTEATKHIDGDAAGQRSNSPCATRAAAPSHSTAAPPSTSETFFQFRLPDDPDPATATPASLCSYLQTMRRHVSAGRAGSVGASTLARRRATQFLHYGLPRLVQCAPGEDQLSPPGDGAAVGGVGAVDSGGEGEALGGPVGRGSSTRRRKEGSYGGVGFIPKDRLSAYEGSGAVPWTTELAQAVLLTMSQVSVPLPSMWAGRAAVKTLLHDAAHSSGTAPCVAGACQTAMVKETGAEGAGAPLGRHGLPASPPTSLDAARVAAQARFAMSLLQSQQLLKRRRALTTEKLKPLSWQLVRRHVRFIEAEQSSKNNVVQSASHDGAIPSSSSLTSLLSPPPTQFQAPVDGADSRVAAAQETPLKTEALPDEPAGHGDRLQIFADVDAYLYGFLLPSLFGELRRFCETMESRYDHAVAARASTSAAATAADAGALPAAGGGSSVTHVSNHTMSAAAGSSHAGDAALHDSCLPVMSPTEQETFAMLLSVLCRTLNMRGVVPARCSEDDDPEGCPNSGFFFRPRQSIDAQRDVAETPKGRGEQRIAGLPLRAFTITLASTAAAVERDAGPQTERLERVLRVSHDSKDTYYSTFDGTHSGKCEGSPTGEGTAHHSPADSGTIRHTVGSHGGLAQASASASPQSARFQQRKAQQKAPSSLCGGGSADACPRGSNNTTKDRVKSTGRESTATSAKSAPPATFTFSVEPLLSILKFCSHDHALELLVSSAGVRSRRPRDSTTVAGTEARERHEPVLSGTGDDMYVEDYANRIAQAHLTILQVSLYWAPVCRTYQLPAVAHAVARICRHSRARRWKAAHASHSTTTTPSCHAIVVGAARSDVSGGDGAVPQSGPGEDGYNNDGDDEALAGGRSGAASTLLDLVHDRVCELFWGCYCDSAAFSSVVRRMMLSAQRYVLKQVPGSFTSTAVELDHILAYWPAELSAGDLTPSVVNTAAAAAATVELDVVARDAPSVPPAHLEMDSVMCYSAPSSATAGVIQFALFMETFWTKMLLQCFWDSIPALARFASLNSRAADATARRYGVGSTQELQRESRAAAVRVPLSAHHVTELSEATKTFLRQHYLRPPRTIAGDLNEGDSQSTATFVYTLPVPPFVLSWLRNRMGDTVTLATPDIIMKVLRVAQHIAYALAIPSSGGRVGLARLLLSEWHATPFLNEVLTGSLEAFFATQEFTLYIAAMRLPAMLGTELKAEGVPGGVPCEASPSLSPLQSESILAPRPSCRGIRGVVWMTLINPLGLYVTPNGRLITRAALAAATRTTNAVVEGGAAAPQFKEAVPLLTDLWESAISWNSTWREIGFTLEEVTSLLRVQHMAYVAEASHLLLRGVRARSVPTRSTQHQRRPLASDDDLGRPGQDSRSQPAALPLYKTTPRLMTLALRASHRVLFSPLDRAAIAAAPSELRASLQKELSSRTPIATSASAREPPAAESDLDVSGDDRLFKHDSVASLETLVTVYLVLHTIADDTRRTATPPNTEGPGGDGAGVSDGKAAGHCLLVPSPYKSPFVASLQHRSRQLRTAVDYCLAQCETVLWERFRKLAVDNTAATPAAAASPPVWNRVPESVDVSDARGSGASHVEVVLQLSLLVEAAWPGMGDFSTATPAAYDAQAGNSEDVNDVRDGGVCDTKTLPQQLQRFFQAELQKVLRACSLRDIAAMLSGQLWWTTLRQQQFAAAQEVLSLPSHTSWVEEVVLAVLWDKMRAVTAESPRRSFEIHEWVLMPFYMKLEQRQQQRRQLLCRATMTRRCSPAVHPGGSAVAAPAAALLDDFTSLEKHFVESDGTTTVAAEEPLFSEAPSTSLSVSPATPPVFRPTSGLETSFLLEKALSALVSHCESFDALLHIVRYLFLSHPVTLTTSPDAAAQLNVTMSALLPPSLSRMSSHAAPSSSRGEAQARVGEVGSLPLQWTDVPQSLRERYVETLYRCFRRLVYLPSTSLEDIVELLHLLWMADPVMSRPDVSSSMAHDHSSGLQRRFLCGGSSRGVAGASGRGWPSLFQRCADFIAEALTADRRGATALHAAGEEEGEEREQRAAAAASRFLVVPPAIQGLRDALDGGIRETLRPHDTAAKPYVSTARLRLSPLPVLLFLQSLAAQVRAERSAMARVAAAKSTDARRPPRHQLTSAQRALLELLEPFVQYTVATSELFLSIPTVTFLPFFLAVLSELDPSAVLTVVRNAFLHRARPRGVKSFHNSPAEMERRLRGRATNSAASRGVFGPEENARSAAAIMAAIVMLEGQGQASSGVWTTAAAASTTIDPNTSFDASAPVAEEQEMAGVGAEVGGVEGGEDDDELACLRRHRSSVQGGRSGTTVPHLGGAHQRAAAYLTKELYHHFTVPGRWQPLRYTDPTTLLQCMQLATIRRHEKLYRSMGLLLLRMLTETEVGVTIARINACSTKLVHLTSCRRGGGGDSGVSVVGSAAGDNGARGDEAGAPSPTSLSPAGHVLLRRLPVSMWRQLFYNFIRFPVHSPYMDKAAHERVERKRGRALQRWTCDLQRECDAPGQEERGRRRAPSNNGVDHRGGSDGVEASPSASFSSSRHEREVFSLSLVLLSLDTASTQTLTRDIMSPSVLLTITADMMQRLWWSRRASFAESETQAAGTARGGPAKAASPPLSSSASSSSSSYDLLMQYASRNSVLREAPLEVYLRESCSVLDQLASADAAVFVDVLQREATWRQLVNGGGVSPGDIMQAGVTGSGGKEDEAGLRPEGSIYGAAVDSTGSDRSRRTTGIDEGDDEEVGGSSDPNVVSGEATGLPHSSSVPSTRAEVVDISADDYGALNRDDDNDEVDTASHAAGAADARTVSRGASPSTATETRAGTEHVNATARPVPGSLVLDWQPIIRFLRVLYAVDPGVMECQLKDTWSSTTTAPSTQTPSSLSAAPPLRRDIFHGGIEAILRRVGDAWHSSFAATNAVETRPFMAVEGVTEDEVSAASPLASQRLQTVNIGMVLDLYSSLVDNHTTSTRDHHQHHYRSPNSGHNSSSVYAALPHQQAVEWLEACFVSGAVDHRGTAASSFFNDAEATVRPVVCTFRTTVNPATAMARFGISARGAVERNCRAVRMCHAGLLMTTQDVEDRLAGLTSRASSFLERDQSTRQRGVPRDGDDDSGGSDGDAGGASVYWQRRQTTLQQCLLETVFGPLATSRVAFVTKSSPEDGRTAVTEAGVERQARRCLELMSCGDVAELLSLLLKKPHGDEELQRLRSVAESCGADGVLSASLPGTRVVQACILMDTLAELLPGASQKEVLRVVQDLLQLYVNMTNFADADVPCLPHATSSCELSESAGDAATVSSRITFEVRRLLSSVGVLLANDAERFTERQLVWLLSRLHTPRLRGAAPATSRGRKGGDAVTSAKLADPRNVADMALDVSESFVSAAVARALRLTLNDASVVPSGVSTVVVDGQSERTIVTVRQWMTAVAAAEQKPSSKTLSALLALIETTAV
jgi:hypothetical protein